MDKKKQLELGMIVYYGRCGDLHKGIFCGMTQDNKHCIIFQLTPQPIVRNIVANGCDHEFFACTEEWLDEVFLSSDELTEHLVDTYRTHVKQQLDTM